MDPVIINTAQLFEQQPPNTWFDMFGPIVVVGIGIGLILPLFKLLAEYVALEALADEKAKNDDKPKNDHKRKNDELLLWNDEQLVVVDAPDTGDTQAQQPVPLEIPQWLIAGNAPDTHTQQEMES